MFREGRWRPLLCVCRKRAVPMQGNDCPVGAMAYQEHRGGSPANETALHPGAA